ncbi:phage repressor protein C with HTH and peptisase S24 domain [Rhodovulum sulfidophilum]|uniref:XRE family transcriptional regulator n=1 Tax=Rhodovulum sulfidophilum TaxID=35806 RepID=UPI0005AA0589|nr:S24 family peptidase [Rhodovulum sulfidophilum]ANB35953.1 phage repressor protein [Rhodovulum sulfidophilum DSM 1374]ANB39765.1 phage repressor protein [Rhodovulum sulfidophilum]MBL3584613.1 phage repressor protein [Rhodovulum sulfidophilum]MCW2305032.1 phage repressor protein C with HTH and peptisase S24 domain [Rhodovulum sulfidophilum]
MRQSFRDAFLRAIEQSGQSVRNVATQSGVSYEQLKKLFRGNSASTNVDDAVRVAEHFGVTVEEFLGGNISTATPWTVSIAGKVGAGARVPVFDAYEKGGGPQVECPPGLSPHGVVAVEVEGDSMEPVYSAGDILFYTRHTADGVPSEAVGKRCVCECEEGLGWAKVIRLGREPGTFDLHSFNDQSPTMYGVRLKWAAPIRLHWPADLAKKL